MMLVSQRPQRLSDSSEEAMHQSDRPISSRAALHPTWIRVINLVTVWSVKRAAPPRLSSLCNCSEFECRCSVNWNIGIRAGFYSQRDEKLFVLLFIQMKKESEPRTSLLFSSLELTLSFMLLQLFIEALWSLHTVNYSNRLHDFLCLLHYIRWKYSTRLLLRFTYIYPKCTRTGLGYLDTLIFELNFRSWTGVLKHFININKSTNTTSVTPMKLWVVFIVFELL